MDNWYPTKSDEGSPVYEPLKFDASGSEHCKLVCYLEAFGFALELLRWWLCWCRLASLSQETITAWALLCLTLPPDASMDNHFNTRIRQTSDA